MKNDSLSFTYDGLQLATLCADVTVYWRGSVFDRTDGVRAFYDRALKLIRPHVTSYETETMGHIAKVKKDTFDLLPFWLSKPKARRGIFALLLEGAVKEGESSDRAFVFFFDREEEPPMGVMRLVLPVAMMEETPDDFVKLVTDLTRGFDFESGSAGYSINWEPRGDDADKVEEFLMRVSKRYMGVDIPEINTTLVNLQQNDGPAIKCVNWLTLLGAELAEKLGPVAQVRKVLPKDCDVKKLGEGYLIRAGERPLLGDKRKREKLPAYVAVGSLLAPYRVTDHAPLFLDDEEATEEWLSRFDS